MSLYIIRDDEWKVLYTTHTKKISEVYSESLHITINTLLKIILFFETPKFVQISFL